MQQNQKWRPLNRKKALLLVTTAAAVSAVVVVENRKSLLFSLLPAKIPSVLIFFFLSFRFVFMSSRKKKNYSNECDTYVHNWLAARTVCTCNGLSVWKIQMNATNVQCAVCTVVIVPIFQRFSSVDYIHCCERVEMVLCTTLCVSILDAWYISRQCRCVHVHINYTKNQIKPKCLAIDSRYHTNKKMRNIAIAMK